MQEPSPLGGASGRSPSAPPGSLGLGSGPFGASGGGSGDGGGAMGPFGLPAGGSQFGGLPAPGGFPPLNGPSAGWGGFAGGGGGSGGGGGGMQLPRASGMSFGAGGGMGGLMPLGSGPTGRQPFDLDDLEAGAAAVGAGCAGPSAGSLSLTSSQPPY